MVLIPDVIQLSPNVNDAPVRGRTVIIHSTRSGVSMNPSEFQGTLNYMYMPGTTSSHWVVSPSGIKARVVNDSQQAWHAQEDNDNAWGIEVCQGVERDPFSQRQYEAVAEICREYMAVHGVPAVHCKSSSEPGFIGHEETAQGKRNGKSDPGFLWDWAYFLALLQPKKEDIPDMKWVTWKDRPQNVIFRTYLVWPDRDGLYSRFVPNIEEDRALREVGYILEPVSIETLRQFRCIPDPAS